MIQAHVGQLRIEPRALGKRDGRAFEIGNVARPIAVDVVDQHRLDSEIAGRPSHAFRRIVLHRGALARRRSLKEPTGADVRLACREQREQLACAPEGDYAKRQRLLAGEAREQVMIESDQLAVGAWKPRSGAGTYDRDELAALLRCRRRRRPATPKQRQDADNKRTTNSAPDRIRRITHELCGIITIATSRVRIMDRSTAGRPALHGREPGQVRKEAAKAILCKCRGNGSPPPLCSSDRPDSI